MIIIGVNNYNSLIYVFSEDKVKVNLLLAAIKNNKIEDGTLYKNYMVIIKEQNTGKYYFFFDEYRNKKDARHASKVLLHAVLQSFSISTANTESYNNSEHIILHNAKNIIQNITNSLRDKLKYDELVYQDDKINFIRNLIEKNTYDYSRELLCCEKALEQVSFEYNCLDFITSGELLDSSDRTVVKIHSCLVQSFYIYEHEFKEKNIKVEINKNYDSFFCNFFSIRSAFALLFENCVKYCQENTDVTVSIDKQRDGSIKIDFDMISVFNTDLELDTIFLEHRRGEEAKKKTSGKGLGLFLVRRLLDINGFSVTMKRMSNTDTYNNEIHFCRNIFIINIPSKFIE